MEIQNSGGKSRNSRNVNIIYERTTRKLYHEGHSKTRVAEILNLDFRTAQKYIDNDPEYALLKRVPRVDYASYLDDLIRGYGEGEKLSVVYRRIESKGFRGTQRGLGARFGALFKEGKQNYRKVATKNLRTRYSGRTISPRKLTIYLTNKHYEKILTQEDVELFRELRINNPLIEELWTLSEGFRKIFEKNSTLLFKEWTDKVMHSSFGSLRRFVKGLSRDLEAVKAAIMNKGNNGQTEGNVNRLKNIKRQMYGRAGFELLRRKVILSNTG